MPDKTLLDDKLANLQAKLKDLESKEVMAFDDGSGKRDNAEFRKAEALKRTQFYIGQVEAEMKLSAQ